MDRRKFLFTAPAIVLGAKAATALEVAPPPRPKKPGGIVMASGDAKFLVQGPCSVAARRAADRFRDPATGKDVLHLYNYAHVSVLGRVVGPTAAWEKFWNTHGVVATVPETPLVFASGDSRMTCRKALLSVVGCRVSAGAMTLIEPAGEDGVALKFLAFVDELPDAQSPVDAEGHGVKTWHGIHAA